MPHPPFSFERHYVDVCNSLDVIPATFFLRHIKDKELDLRHRGFKAEEIHALSKALVVREQGP